MGQKQSWKLSLGSALPSLPSSCHLLRAYAERVLGARSPLATVSDPGLHMDSAVFIMSGHLPRKAKIPSSPVVPPILRDHLVSCGFIELKGSALAGTDDHIPQRVEMASYLASI